MERGRPCIAAVDADSGEALAIRGVRLAGACLKFTTLVESSGWEVRHEWWIPAGGCLEDKATATEHWRRANPLEARAVARMFADPPLAPGRGNVVDGRVRKPATNAKRASTVDPRQCRDLCGVWKIADASGEHAHRIRVREGRLEVASVDTLTGEVLAISGIRSKGPVLRFNSLCESNGYRLRHQWTLVAKGRFRQEMTHVGTLVRCTPKDATKPAKPRANATG
jgi:hypothetical protein